MPNEMIEISVNSLYCVHLLQCTLPVLIVKIYELFSEK